MPSLLGFVGRLLLALLFVSSGISKLLDPAGTESSIAAVGLPNGLAIPVGIFELVAGLALVLGIATRLFAILLAAFCLLTAFFFHNNFADPVQAAQLLKNVAIAGGLLCLCGLSSMRWSYDAMRERRHADALTRDAEHRAHEAELRAARAEGAVEAARAAPGTVVTDVNRNGIPEVRKRRWF